jgi:hypothetical protein
MGVELTSAYALGKQPALLYSIPNVPNVHHVLACKKDSTQGIGGKPFPLIIRAAAALLTVDQTEQQLAASGVVCVGDLKIDRPKDTNQGERNMHASICLHASPSRTLAVPNGASRRGESLCRAHRHSIPPLHSHRSLRSAPRGIGLDKSCVQHAVHHICVP